VSKNPAAKASRLSPAAQETESAVERLTTQIEDARAALSNRTSDDTELEACADRIERAARDLSVALRELAKRRRDTEDES
jgi:small-conductance mechanosensitive channel